MIEKTAAIAEMQQNKQILRLFIKKLGLTH